MLTGGRTAIQFCRIPLIDVVTAIDQIAARSRTGSRSSITLKNSHRRDASAVGQHLRAPCESAARRVLSWAIAVNENANWEAIDGFRREIPHREELILGYVGLCLNIQADVLALLEKLRGTSPT